MKLNSLNEDQSNNIEDIEDTLEKYVTARGAGNINKNKSENNPDKTSQQVRSGDEYATPTNDKDKEDLLGASGNGRDKQSASNLTNPSL